MATPWFRPMYRHGHYGAALLASAPAVLVAGPPLGFAFSLVAVATSMLPDLDTRSASVPHRGSTHTLAFAVAVAVALGLLATVGWLALQAVSPATNAPALAVGAFVAAGTLLGVGSHLAADALNPGYGTNAIRPFRPVSDRAVRLAIARVDSPAWNWGLLVAGLVAQALAASLAGGLG